jgi:hypothetical protein
MLTPIVTKDMKLFPSQPVPAAKNVRYRAKSLQEFAAANKRSTRVYNGTLSPPKVSGGDGKAGPGGKNLLVAAAAQRQRNSNSINSLPLNAPALTVVGPGGGVHVPITASSNSLSAFGVGKQLSAIIEGLPVFVFY